MGRDVVLIVGLIIPPAVRRERLNGIE